MGLRFGSRTERFRPDGGNRSPSVQSPRSSNESGGCDGTAQNVGSQGEIRKCSSYQGYSRNGEKPPGVPLVYCQHAKEIAKTRLGDEESSSLLKVKRGTCPCHGEQLLICKFSSFASEHRRHDSGRKHDETYQHRCKMVDFR
jgi:hypothetical protein